MTILHIRSQYVVDGGVETFMLALISRISRPDMVNDIVLFTTRDTSRPGFHKRLASKMGGSHITVPWDKHRLLWPTIKKVAELIRRNHVDVIHTHDNRANIVGFILTRLLRMKIPWIASAHGWVSTPLKSRLIGFVDKELIRFADIVHFASRVLFKQIRSLPEGRMIDIPYFLDTAPTTEYHPEKLKEHWGIPQNHMVLGMVGRLTLEKGHVYLLGAMKRVLRTCPDTTLLIVGDGPLRKQLETMAAVPELKDHVRFLGFYKDAIEACATFDVFVSSSLHETISIVQLEALSLEKPIVATLTGANEETVRSGENGFLVPPGDPKALADAIGEVLQGEKPLHEFGKASTRLYEEKYSPDVLAERYRQVYAGLAGA